jgi:hypothetical protein
LLSARRTSLRKYRLFAVACCRFDIKAITNPDCRALIALSEQWADGEVEAIAVRQLRRKVHSWALQQVYSWKRWIAIWGAYQTAKPVGPPVMGFFNRARYRPLLADIIGPSPMTSAFSPKWRTDTALALAQQMYESRDFSAMPILADALQDAGCDDEDILNHCRNPKQVHMRGCWVVDLVLGK